MKKTISIILTMILSVIALGPVEVMAADAGEEEAVIAVVLDYIDGWYDGDVARMENALHPDLAKRSIQALKNGAEFVNTLSASNMIEYTKAGFGKKNKQENQKSEVIILDILSQTASVKAISPEYIDYIHLAKVNGKWWIVNVLWEPNR